MSEGFLADPRIQAFRAAIQGGKRRGDPDFFQACYGMAEYCRRTIQDDRRESIAAILVGQDLDPRAVEEAFELPAESLERYVVSPRERHLGERVRGLRALPYEKYLLTEHWGFTRRLAMERAGSRCQACRATRGLEVHHNTYENIGEEQPEDLIVLCRSCHRTFHDRREERP